MKKAVKRQRNFGVVEGEPCVMMTSTQYFDALDGLPRRVRLALQFAPYVVSPTDIVNELKSGRMSEADAVRFLDYVMKLMMAWEAKRLYGPSHPQVLNPDSTPKP